MKYFIKLSTLLFLLIQLACSHLKKDVQLPLASFSPLEKREEHHVFAKKFAIAAQGEKSTQAAIKMTEIGGNIFDAFVAASFCISVEAPQSTGIGGGGFALISFKGATPEAFDFRERAPLKSTKEMYLDKNKEVIFNSSIVGLRASGVPGLVKGLIELHQKYGKLKLSVVMSPSIELARNGFVIYPDLGNYLKSEEEKLKLFPSTKEIFFKNGQVLKTGEILIQNDLAKTLSKIATDGEDYFYKTTIAKKIVVNSKNENALFELADFKKYQMIKRNPIQGSFQGLEVYSMPPPSSGGVHLIQILNTIENDLLKSSDPNSIHLISSSMQQAFADRSKYLGDPDFVQVPTELLSSKEYAKKMRKNIVDEKAKLKNEVNPSDLSIMGPDHTTHLSLMDDEGNAISSTQTINGPFGSYYVLPGTGILMNNEMDDFAIKPNHANIFGAIGSENNSISPFKTPLSSMSPTIVFKNNLPYLTLGSPSGTRILTCVANTIINFTKYKMPLFESVATIRFHHQWTPDEIRVDSPGFPPEINKSLLSFGYKINIKDLGCKVQAILHDHDIFEGVSDPRGFGRARGR